MWEASNEDFAELGVNLFIRKECSFGYVRDFYFPGSFWFLESHHIKVYVHLFVLLIWNLLYMFFTNCKTKLLRRDSLF